MADFYRILGVAEDAGEGEVKKAFRKIALECHPDRHSGSSPEVKAQAGARFKAASEAYDTLVDARKRATYISRSSPSTGSSYNRQYNPHSYNQHAYHRAAPSRDALFHAGIAALLILGVTVGSSSGEMMWSSWNKGRLFEDIKTAEQRVQRKPSGSSTSAARAAADFAASGGRSRADAPAPSFAAGGASLGTSGTSRGGEVGREASRASAPPSLADQEPVSAATDRPPTGGSEEGPPLAPYQPPTQQGPGMGEFAMLPKAIQVTAPLDVGQDSLPPEKPEG